MHRALGLAAVILSVMAAPADAATNTIVTIAGTGAQGFSGDGGPATTAMHRQSDDVVPMPDGGFIFSDFGDNRVRRVSPAGIITTIAGSGLIGSGGDGGPATAANLWSPAGIAVRADGSVLIADSNSRVVRSVSPSGIITRVAGTTNVFCCYPGDGGPATSSVLSGPQGVTVTPDGGYLIADGSRVLKVSAAGTITTVAGTGSGGFSGDGGPATSAQLGFANEVALTADGGMLIADGNNRRIRRVSPAGIISTVAGSGSSVFAGDGGPALAAGLNSPRGVEAMPDGGFLIADAGHGRVRRVSSSGTITTIAGNGGGLGGTEGGPAVDRGIGTVSKVSLDAEGDILIPGAATARIYRVDAGDPVVPDTTAPVVSCGAADGEWHDDNVTIACTASDGESGLASSGDAAFSLSTSVVAGTENANAATGIHPAICDVVGNCSAVIGPVGGNKVDRKAPGVALTRPANGARYGLLSGTVKAAYSCTDGGSGMGSCVGTQPSSATINTSLSALGKRTFTVTATDVAGNTTVVTHRYTVTVLGLGILGLV